ncbi:MAG: nucleotidyltransferase domain-containing protein [Candidatus Omnitrophica bacterium]|nr:nucleotidyltransferase domain-containing protein [Candidatus Omnitrophota bacterium]MBU1524358.1 nucleotidyltransferase domain-containing protein [Candidatus Omnitrophota bacterium]
MAVTIEERKHILNEEVKRITEVVIREYSPEKIILFGSLAAGNIHEWSDIDLVIIKSTAKRFIDRLHDIHLLVKPKVGVNFIVYTPQEVQKMVEENRYFLVKEIFAKGKVLYEEQ